MPAWDFFPLICSTFEKTRGDSYTVIMTHDNNESTVHIQLLNRGTGTVDAVYKSDKDQCRFGLVVLHKA